MQVAKHPFITPGPSSAFTPPPTRHSTLPGVSQGVLAGMQMTGSLPHYYNGQSGSAAAATMTPVLGGRENSVCSSGYPTPRPGSAASGFASGFDTSFSMGSPLIGSGIEGVEPSNGGKPKNLFRSFPRPHSSPKMKLRLLTLKTNFLFVSFPSFDPSCVCRLSSFTYCLHDIDIVIHPSCLVISHYVFIISMFLILNLLYKVSSPEFQIFLMRELGHTRR